MRTAYRLAILTGLGLLQFPAASWAASYQLINAGADFERFVQESSGQDSTDMRKAWDQFEAQYPVFYRDYVYDSAMETPEARKERLLSNFFPKLPALQSEMGQVFSHADSIMAPVFGRFTQALPDLRPNVQVYFVPSLLTFNGRAVENGGPISNALFMGVDLLVARHDDIPLVATHELFHVYQFGIFPNGAFWKTFATPLWVEGLATYASGVIDSPQTDRSILFDDSLADACANGDQVKRWAQEYLPILDETPGSTPDKAALYQRWFQMRRTHSGDDTIDRAGYCLGLRVVQSLAKSHPLSELAHWDEPRFLEETRAQLSIIAK